MPYTKRNKTFLGLISKYLPLAFWAFLVIYPLLIVVFTSFKTDEEYVKTSAFELPSNFLNFQSYITAFNQGGFTTAFLNSVILVVVSCAVNVLLGAMTAYCLSRFDFKGKKILTAIYILSAMVPSITLQISIYPILKTLRLIGTMNAPLLLYIGTDIIQIWIYLQFMNKISVSLDESAMIEGASYFRIFRTIIFPMLMPATATVIILKAVNVYNDMFIQHLYMSKPSLRTVTTALMVFSGDRINAQNLMMAAIVMVMIPTILLFLSLQKYIFSGITAGAVKE
ncbi:MAG: carbohydrate ABC transporter permease [Clostridia bacterium]|nr:carbohydrate ABC transporter permease [Clostridia bacterium]